MIRLVRIGLGIKMSSSLAPRNVEYYYYMYVLCDSVLCMYHMYLVQYSRVCTVSYDQYNTNSRYCIYNCTVMYGYLHAECRNLISVSGRAEHLKVLDLVRKILKLQMEISFNLNKIRCHGQPEPMDD